MTKDYFHRYYLAHKKKRNKQSREWSKNNPEARARIVKRTKVIIRLEFRAFVNSFKARPCLDCKRRFPPVCMDFDHRDERKKYRTIAIMCGFPKSTILKEIKKCDVICANCHRIRTQKQRNYYQ